MSFNEDSLDKRKYYFLIPKTPAETSDKSAVLQTSFIEIYHQSELEVISSLTLTLKEPIFRTIFRCLTTVAQWQQEVQNKIRCEFKNSTALFDQLAKI